MIGAFWRWLGGQPSRKQEQARAQALAASIAQARPLVARFALCRTIKPSGIAALGREIAAAPNDARIEERDGQVRIYFADGRQMRCGEKFLCRRTPGGEFSIEIFQSDGEKLVIGRAADGSMIIQHSLRALTWAMQQRLEKALVEAENDPAFTGD